MKNNEKGTKMYRTGWKKGQTIRKWMRKSAGHSLLQLGPIEKLMKNHLPCDIIIQLWQKIQSRSVDGAGEI